MPVFKLHAESSMVELWHPKRKNRLKPSSSFRPCWCKKCCITCPVHVLGAYMAEFQMGYQPFAHISPKVAGSGLKRMLDALGVPEAEKYTTQVSWVHALN